MKNSVILCLLVAGMSLSASADEVIKKVNILGTDGNVIEGINRAKVAKITFVKDPNETTINGHTFINMGTIVDGKNIWWAKVNVGATIPQDYGDYFAWGEVNTKYAQISSDGGYVWATYKWSTDGSVFTKYNTDGTTTLESTDDVVTSKWGTGCRLPSQAEWQALVDLGEGAWAWSAKSIADASHTDAGYTVTSPTTGKSIFIPAAGYNDGTANESCGEAGLYWSASLCSELSSAAYSLGFDERAKDSTCSSDRCKGLVARAVAEVE